MLTTGSDARFLHGCKHLGMPLLIALLLSLTIVPVALASSQITASLAGPKQYYLALGDSLAYGYQPDLDFADGYSNDFAADLKTHGMTTYSNMGCPGETSVTFLNGKCPDALLRKYLYLGSQLHTAVHYLQHHAGQVSPVTLDIGINDILPDINTSTCSVNVSKFDADLATVDTNLTQTILPALKQALTVNGRVTGDLLLMNYYNAYQNICPSTLPYVQLLDQHLASDISGSGSLVDVFTTFGGPSQPNVCSYTWMCTIFKDIHPKDKGYSVIAAAFERTAGY
jgi:lysophospholipase L1-like esterase